MTIDNDIQIGKRLWYQIGGRAKYVLTCYSRQDIEDAISFIREKKIERVFVCGQGSNLIFTDDFFDGVVMQIAPKENDPQIQIDDKSYVSVFAGELLDTVIRFSFEHSLIGLEWAGGLPGTVGAAVRGNVGAYGGEIKDTLMSVDVLDFSGEMPLIKTLSRDDLAFSYRSSSIKTHKKQIVLFARFNLQKASMAELEAAQDVYHKRMQQRKENHPLEYPNCGSVFKNLRDETQIIKVLSVFPDLKEQVEKRWHGKVAVASLIERLGLKGYRVGNAQVSEKHALFIVNLGGAKAKEVLQVIDTIQKKFEETFGFQLETEVEIVK